MAENNYRQEILLESGTNEIELMEFKIGKNVFGINVAKVTEIMMSAPVKAMPHSHPAIEGVYKPREVVLTVVNLPEYLNLVSSDTHVDRDLFIVTSFNKLNIAFRVNEVVGIDRVSWGAIQKPDKTIYGSHDGVATGLVEFDGRLITILDFEKIVAEIAPVTSIQISDIESLGERDLSEIPLVVAEDSILLSKLISDSLEKAGFNNVTKFDNGKACWDYLEMLENDENITEKVACVVTDIEMPAMDGHHLTKKIKEHPVLKAIPVIIFSSLITKEMYRKGVEIGADEQLSKPEIAGLVTAIDKVIQKNMK